MNISTSTSATNWQNTATTSNNNVISRLSRPASILRWFFVLMMFAFAAVNVNAQSLANYTFGYSQTASLTDMTSGTTVLVGLETGTYYDSKSSLVTDMPIPFVYMGALQTKFSCNSNGQLRFGTTVISTTSISGPAAGISYLAPMAGDNAMSASGVVHYKVTGSAPNRVMTIAWDSILIPTNAVVSTPAGVVQARLYETSGVIEYVYGNVYNNSASAQTRSIFLCSSNTATTNGYVTVGATPTFTLAASNVTNSFAGGPSYIANLSSTTDGSRWMYSWTPTNISLADPTSLNITNVGVTSMTLNWTAASPTTGITGYAILVSTDGGTSYAPLGSVALGTNTFNATGLTPNTVYTFAIHSYGGESTLSTNPTTATQATNACSISGVKTVGPGGDYTSLGQADSALVANGLSGAVILELNASYTSTGESFPISLKAVPCASATNTITIRPAAGATGRSITSANTTGTLLLDSADYYIIDGRLGGVGSPDLLIANTSTGYGIRFVNDATNNTVKYITATSGSTSTTSGVIVFSTTAVAGGIGNDNNTIDNCDLNGGGLVNNVIYAAGSTTTLATYNSGIVISNNKIRDMFRAATATNGILIATANSDWTISGNSIYQTASRTYTTAQTHTGINLSVSTVNNMSITNNYIGGNTVNAGGTATIMNGAVNNRYRGISLTVSTTTASSVQGNTITNFDFTSSTGSTTVGGPWCGIYVSAGTVNIGTVTGNTIGAATGTGSVLSTITTTTSGVSSGIYIDGGTLHNIANNTIGSVNTVGTASLAHGFTGIHVATSTTSVTVNGNTIGSTSTGNSINASFATTGTTAPVVTGILQGSSATVAIINNTIANLNNNYAPAAVNAGAFIRGIYASSGIDSIAGNTVRNLSVSGNGNGTGNNASVTGISNFSSTAGNNYIRANTIHSLTNSNVSAACYVTGIFYNGPTTGGTIDRNLVYSLTTPSIIGFVNGINAGGQTATYQNNMIRLGIDAAGVTTATATNYNGILETAGNNSFLHNTVYIGGTGVNTSPPTSTYAFYNNALLTGTRVIRNNIFINERTSGSTGGKHYAIRIGGTAVNPTGLTINNNLYRATGAFEGVFGSYNGSDVISLTAWQAAVGGDAASIDTNPCLVNPTAATPDLHLTDCAGAGSPADGAGSDLGVTEDYDNQTRATLTPTDIGADAGNYGVIGVDVGVSALVAPATPAGCLTATETVTVTLKNYGVNPIDLSINPATVTVTATGGYSSNIVVNSGVLASNATQNVVLPATIDMTTAGIYTFNATATVSGDVNTANDALPPQNINFIALGGTYTVGAGGNYLTLTAAIAAYNAATCFSAPVVFSLTDATYNAGSGETFPIVINQNTFAGANTLTIRPAAATAVTITGTSGVTASSLIKLNGADNIIIDGINSGGASLTIENTSVTGGTAVIWLASTGTGAGATNNTIQNTNIKAGVTQSTATTVTYGIVMAGGTLSATLTSVTAGDDNDNNTFTGNTFTKVRYGIFTRGGATANPNTGTVITNNIIGPAAFGADQIGQSGVLIREEDGINISGNTIRFVGGDYANTTGGADRSGIAMGTLSAWTPTSVYVKNATITRNLIHDIRDERTFSAVGIIVAGADGANATNNIIANNMISNVTANGTSGDQTIGIGIAAGNGDKVVFNSISLTGDTDPNASAAATALSSFGISITAAANLDLRNNIVHMDLSSSSTPALANAAINIPASYAWGTGGSNYNNLSVVASNTQSNVGCEGGVTFHTTLANWQTAVTQDANSTDVLPVFTSATNLHLIINSNPLLDDTGTPVSGITGDYDNDTRDVTTPDMGADEFSAPVGVDISPILLVTPGESGCYGGTETVTVRIKNNSAVVTHDLSTDNVTVTVTATGGYSSSIIINTGTIAPLGTLDVVLPATIDMSVNGAYVFNGSAVITTGGPDLNTVNDTLATTTRTGVPVSVGTVSASPNAYCLSTGRPTITLSAAAGGTIQWQVSTDGTNWTNVGSDSLQYTPAVDLTADTSYFKAIVTCTVSSTILTSNIDTVILYNPSVTGTTPANRCGTGTVNLGATGTAGATLKWYTTATGGTSVATGNTYSPTLSTTTSFWVTASQGGGGQTNVSKAAPEPASTGTVLSTYGQDFTVTEAFDLVSVQVYSTTGTSIKISLFNSTGTTELQTTGDVAVTAGATSTIPLGFSITPGTYRLVTNGMTGNFIRDNTGVTYPFALGTVGTMNGFVSSITGTVTTSSSYYFTYNWLISQGCESPRTEVIATVTTAPTISLGASPTSLCAGQSTNLTVSSGYDPNYTYTWSPATTPASGAAVSATPASTGYIVVTATDNLGSGTYAGCVKKDSINITVNPLPDIIVMNPATSAIVCVGGNVTLNATSGQSITQTLGTQTTTDGTNHPYRTGLGNSSRHQFLYLASELTTAGFSAGNITGIGFTITTLGTGSLNNYSIKMSNVTAGALTTTFLVPGSFTTVYSNATPPAPVSGLNTYTFTTPFSWNGSSDVLVEICYDNITVGASSTVAATTPGTISNVGSLGSATACTNLTGTTGANRPLTTFIGNTASPITWSPATDLNTTTGNTVISTPTSSPIKYYATATLGTCTRVDSVTVTLSDLAVSAAVTANVTCFGGNNGSVTGTATGGSATYTYTIAGPTVNTTGETTGVFTGLTAGSYTITVNDGTCNSTSTSVTITETAAVTSSITASTDPTCNSASPAPLNANGSVTAVGAGGTGPYTYTISGPTVNTTGAATGIFTDLTAGSYTVTATDFNGCTGTSTAQVLNNPAAPAVSAANNGPICANTNATLTATPNTYVSYSWTGPVTINNANTDIATAVTPADNDVFTVTITDALGCTNTATTTVSVIANDAVSVTLAVSPSTEICDGSSVTFTATPTNGGATPNYEFFVGATSVQNGTSNTYTTTTLVDQDVVTVVLTSSITCTTGSPATSNAITMTVSGFVNADVTLAASPSGTVCSGTSVTYTATPTAGGPAPTYEFFVNAVSVQNSASATYTYAPANGDLVYVVMTSSFDCALNSPATSPTLTASVNPTPAAPTVTAGGPITFCNGGSVVLTSDSSGIGNQWYIDGILQSGETNPTITATTSGTYTVTYTENGCTSVPSVPVVVTVNANPVATITGTPSFCTASSTILSAATSAAGSGTITGYQWVLNGVTNLGTAVTETVSAIGSYTVIVTNSNGCSTTSAATVVTENIPPTAGVTAVCNTIAPLETAVLTATPATGVTYSWSLDAGPELSTANPYTTAGGATGTYTVTVTDGNGCTGSANIVISPRTGALVAGTYNIPETCGTGFQSIASAVAYLNANGITGTGNVTFNVAAGHTETAASSGIILNMCALGGSLQPSATLPIIFQKSGAGANPLITAGAGTGSVDVIFGMAGTDYVTIDGIDLAENAGNTTATTKMEWGYVLTGCSDIDGAQYNTVKNCVVTLDKSNTNSTVGIAIYSVSIGTFAAAVPVTNISGTNSYNKIYSNTVTNSLHGIRVRGFDDPNIPYALYDQDNEIGAVGQGNTITNFGRGTNPNSANGIFCDRNNNLKINGNTVNSTGGATHVGSMTGIETGYARWANVEIQSNTVTVANNAATNSTGAILAISCNSGNREFYNNNLAPANTILINGNTVQNCNIPKGLFRALSYNRFDTLGANTVTFSNNQVINNTSTADTVSSLVFGGILSQPAVNVYNVTNNTLTNNNWNGPAATAAHPRMIVLSMGWVLPATSWVQVNNVTGNTISNNNSTSTGGAVSGIVVETLTTGTALAGSATNISNNTVGNVTQTAVSTATYSGIITSSGANVAVTMNNNTVTNVTRNSATTGAFDGIRATGTAKSVIMNGNTVSNISATGATTAIFNAITSTGSSTLTDTLAMNNNIVTGNNFAGTGSFICMNGGLSAGGASISGNQVTNNQKTGASGLFDGVTFTGSSTLTDTLAMSNNTVSGNVLNGTGTMTLMDAGAAVKITMNNNLVNNNQKSGASGTMYCSRAGTSQITYSGNTISNNSIPTSSGTTAASIYGYYNLGSPTLENYTNNNINNLSIGGTNTSTSSLIYGMYSNSTASSVKEYSGNTVHTLSMTTPGNMIGIHNALGTVNIFKNKIYNLSSSGASATAQVDGIRLTSGTNTKVYNNIIGDLRSTATTGTDAVRGISSLITTATSTLGIYFNTIWLNGTSSAATFGNSGIFITTSTTATTAALSMSNNLVINTSTPKGTARAVAYRRSSISLTNFTTASNNNLYYVTAGANNHIYSDGTNHLDLAAYKGFAGISPRETNSQTENVTFVSTTGSNAAFLHIDPVAPTLVEGGAINIAGITDDFDSDIRQGNVGYLGTSIVGPDIGADELDATPPPCIGAVGGTATAAAFSCTNNSASIMTATGVSTGGGITYQWEVSATGGGVGFAAVTGGSGANTLVYTSPTGLALGNYYYRLAVTCSAGPVTAYSNELTIEVRQSPTASASNSGPICSGASLTLTGTTDIGTTFLWSGPGGFTSTLQSPVFTTGSGSNGVYTFTATSAGGCPVSATTNATVNITPSPITVTPAVSILCEGSSQVLTATGGQLGAVTEIGTQQNQNATSGYPAPYSAYFGSQRMQTLIRASELTAAGFFAGTQFTAINFPVVSFGSNWGSTITSCNDFQVKAGFVDPGTVNTMTAFQAGLTQVVAPSNFTPVVGYNNEHSFSTPLTWNGTDNLIIETTFGNNFSGTVNETVIQYNTTTSYQSTITYRADNVTAAAAAAATTVSTSSSARPDFKLTGSAGAALTYNWSPATGLSSTTGASVTASPTSFQTYTVTTVNAGCSGTPGTASITINPLPSGASISGTTAVCQNATQPTVTFTASVGTAPYTFTYNINGGANQTVTSLSGTNPVSVTVPVPTGTPGIYIYNLTNVADIYCANTATGSATVTVNALPDASFTGLAGPYCANAAAVTLTSTQTSGTFSGPGVTNNGDGTASFSPATAGAGTHSITFSYTDGNGCVNSSSQNVTVNALPTVSFTGLPATICVHAAAFTLTGNQAPNGTFTGAGITDNANGTASFNPATAGVGGPYIITYTYTDVNGCTNSASQTISVTANFGYANLQWPPNGSYCAGGSLTAYGQVYKLGLTEAAGAGAGITAELGWNTTNTDPATWTNWQSAAFNVQVGNNDEYSSTLSLPAGTYYYTFRYSLDGCGFQYGGYSAGGGNFWDGTTYVSGVLTVNALPTVSFTGLSASYCVNAGSVVLTGNQAPNGTFSGPGITDNANGTATFNPATAGAGGPYSITYTYSDGTCSNSDVQTVTVNALPTVSFSGLALTYCTTDAAVTLTGSPVGGTFSGPGITGNTFDPAAAGAGTHSITYTYTDVNGCSNSSSQNVTVTVCATFTTLNLTAFLEGFYYDINTMRATIYDLGISTDPTETDTLMVNLWAATSLSNPNPDYTVQAVVHTDGTATMQFPAGVTGNSYYIAVKHRNHLETWSKLPVAFTASTSYNFTTAQSQAYDDGFNNPMASVAGGKFAFYGGDVNQDGQIEASDLADVDNDNSGFAYGYNDTDATGDGPTDASDLQIVDNNSQLFLFYARPY